MDATNVVNGIMGGGLAGLTLYVFGRDTYRWYKAEGGSLGRRLTAERALASGWVAMAALLAAIAWRSL